MLWRHVITYWRAYVLPDLRRLYPSLVSSAASYEDALLALPWRDLREVILSLFGIPESLTGAAFSREHRKEADQ